MNNLFRTQDRYYQFSSTEDGSPTVSISSSPTPSEKMHHSAGAFSESIAIYLSTVDLAAVELAAVEGTAVELAAEELSAPKSTQAQNPKLRILSIGLGLGYNEILITAYSLKHNLSDVTLESFESDPFLKDTFLSWIHSNLTQSSNEVPSKERCGTSDSSKIKDYSTVKGDSKVKKSFLKNAEPFFQAYEQVLEMAARWSQVPLDDIRKRLHQWILSDNLVLRDSLMPSTEFKKGPFSIILYDAFSSETSPELWQEEFLKNFIEKAAAPHSFFATYASTGTLKRALKAKGFALKKKPGFSGKRESTLAIRP
jgi:hypothetical protein